MTTERWLPIAGYKGFYEVSDLGRVRSLTRVVPGRPGRTYTVSGRVLLARPHGETGYPTVHLCRKGVRRNIQVHRLVLLAFAGPAPRGMQCCHNDGVRTNNSITNLRWDTIKANSADRRVHGTLYFGERNAASKLTQEEVRQIRVALSLGMSKASIARAYRVADTHVLRIARGETRKAA